jgi:hypothetical protein
MKRYTLIFLLFASLGVLASSENVRTFVITQFRAIIEPLFEEGEATQPKFDAFYAAMVEELPVQQRAERALELSINRFTGATDYVLENAQDWRGEIETNSRLETLTTTALNAPLIEIRMAGFELYLAQYDLEKSIEQIDHLLEQFERHPEKNAAGSLWAIAAIAARGIDRERVFDEIIAASESDNTKIRRGAVEALARFGGQEIIEPLLYIARNDSSSYIQERAFCGLAQTGTLHVIERYDALPGLLQTLRDPYSTDQQHSWVYQALKEISNFYDVSADPDEWEKRLLEVDMLKESND